MHAIQTSGNCIRNVTADHYAGVAADEIADPRPYAEILRQWSSLHPEFSFLPRKFKIAVNGASHDRAVIQAHDIGLQLARDRNGELGFAVYVGGGLGRTPLIGRKVREFLPERDLLAYADAILRVYNLEGRRDNKFKARIKILLHEKGLEALREAIEAEFAAHDGTGLTLPAEEIARIAAYFAPPPLEPKKPVSDRVERRRAKDAKFSKFFASNVTPHKTPGYAIVTISLKPIGGVPGDASADQIDAVADLAEDYSHDEARVSHEQNLILPHVALDDLTAVYDRLASVGLATPNAGLISDIIACPGLDYCALATARSIPIAQRLSERFGDGARARAIGPLKIKISGCINACGHHHVGHIGILGLERAGEETYQVTLGGSADENAAIGQIVGPGFSSEAIVGAVETVVETYMAQRNGPEEDFLAAFRRLGMAPFKEALYERSAGADI
jgi:sulfite reductase (NADPH) hemoprotein beta-component